MTEYNIITAYGSTYFTKELEPLAEKFLNSDKISVVTKTGKEKVSIESLSDPVFYKNFLLSMDGRAFCRESLTSAIVSTSQNFSFGYSYNAREHFIKLYGLNRPSDILNSHYENVMKIFLERRRDGYSFSNHFSSDPVAKRVRENHKYSTDTVFSIRADREFMLGTTPSALVNILRYFSDNSLKSINNFDDIINLIFSRLDEFYSSYPEEFYEKYGYDDYLLGSYDGYDEDLLVERYPPFFDPSFVLWMLLYKYGVNVSRCFKYDFGVNNLGFPFGPSSLVGKLDAVKLINEINLSMNSDGRAELMEYMNSKRLMNSISSGGFLNFKDLVKKLKKGIKNE